MKHLLYFTLALLCLMLSACGVPAEQTALARRATTATARRATPPPATRSRATATPIRANAASPSETVMSSPNIPAEARPLVNRAIADLGDRFSLSTQAITVVSVQPATWPNAQLGCGGAPMDDAMPVDGYQIILSAQKQQWDYHTSKTTVVWCDPHRQ